MTWKVLLWIRLIRVTACLVGAFLLGPAFAMLLIPSGEAGGLWLIPALVVGLVVAAFWLLLAFNCLRMGVEVTAGEVIVRGYLKATRIPAASVTAVSTDEYPSIVWHERDGTIQVTGISAFTVDPRVKFFAGWMRRRNEHTMREVEHYLLGHQRP